ncbi:MAG: NAD(P)/FAD-dependent oxidoreductase [Chloroflexi bacterium]|nr:NAD(P)/FAD-dependent oxidoreductase [Chloroflexota bacterium]
MTQSTSRTVIIGAGPYGLAAAAHLRSAGVHAHVFGEPMSFWDQQMPVGMFLRSPWGGSSIADPHRALTIEHFFAEQGLQRVDRIPLEKFVQYGRWFQHRVVPDVDRRWVTRLERAPGGFQLTLADGETLPADRVIVAAGISPFAQRPAPFDTLPKALVSHATDHRDLRPFSGRRVAVIGGGQSAIESAVLLDEAGAEVELLVRQPSIHWIGLGSRILRRLGPLEGPARKIAYTKEDVGPPGINWFVSAPHVFRRLPRELQDRMARRAIQPAGAAWLQPRVGGVRITMGRAVLSVTPEGERALLRLDDSSERHVDHVLLGTGFRVDIARYPFLAPELVRDVRTVNGYPELTTAFETSVPGLHFLGAPAARSFGPLTRFVAGTEFTAPLLMRGVCGPQPVRTYAAAGAYS